MASYLVYSLNDAGYVQGFDMFDADNDPSAIAGCHGRDGDGALELWCEGRRVTLISRKDRRRRFA